MPNVRQRNELLGVIKQVGQIVSLINGPINSFGDFLAGLSLAYLQNGLTSPAMGSGGASYNSATTSFTVPLPATAPGNSVNAVVSFTNTAGVLSAPVISVPGSGYGTSPPVTYNIPDPNGSGAGATVTISCANTDESYNFSPAQAVGLIYGLGNDLSAFPNVLNGTLGNATVSTFAINAAGSGYAAGDYLFATGGFTLQVATLTGSGVATATVVAGGIGMSLATGLATTTSGSGSGCTINVTVVTRYNFLANLLGWVRWLM